MSGLRREGRIVHPRRNISQYLFIVSTCPVSVLIKPYQRSKRSRSTKGSPNTDDTRARTTSQQRSTLPAYRQGHGLSSGLEVQDARVLTCRSATTRSLPDGSLPELIRTRHRARIQ